MSRRIVIYGHGDRSASGFETPESLCRYLEGGIFSEEGGRYRYTQMKMADVIVLARGGSAFGHFEIDEALAPPWFQGHETALPAGSTIEDQRPIS